MAKQPPLIITEPREGEKVPESRAADWRQGEKGDLKKELGLRTESPSSVDVSRANSVRSRVSEPKDAESESEDGAHGVKRPWDRTVLLMMGRKERASITRDWVK